VGGVPVQQLSFAPGALIPFGLLHTAPTRADSLVSFWYSRELTALNEPRLIDAATHEREVYRFLWLRSFDPPVAVRIQMANDSAVAIVSETANPAVFKPARLTRRDTIRLTDAEWREFSDMLEREQFLAWTPTEPVPGGIDGARWVFEGLRGGRYHIADRWAPSDSGAGASMRSAGLHFIRLGRVRVARDRIY